MKRLILLICILFSFLSGYAQTPLYYIELINPKINGQFLSFDVKINPLIENFELLSGNFRYNFDNSQLDFNNEPLFEHNVSDLQFDVISFAGKFPNKYVNIAFSVKDFKGLNINNGGYIVGKINHKISNISNKNVTGLVKPRINNLPEYKNDLPLTNNQNCTLIFTTDSPYEPVQEGLPVNKVHFYTQQIVGSDSSFEIYPNPSTGFLTYNWSGADSNKDVFVKIFDNTGKLLMSRSMNQQTEGSLDISDYTPGLYFLHFENGGITEKHKIIKVD